MENRYEKNFTSICMLIARVKLTDKFEFSYYMLYIQGRGTMRLPQTKTKYAEDAKSIQNIFVFVWGTELMDVSSLFQASFYS
jgi:hypothetical protein